MVCVCAPDTEQAGEDSLKTMRSEAIVLRCAKKEGPRNEGGIRLVSRRHDDWRGTVTGAVLQGTDMARDGRQSIQSTSSSLLQAQARTSQEKSKCVDAEHAS